MDSIEPNALYDERGEVSMSRPLLQGDVFDGVVLPGFGDEPMLVQIVTHPCSMRKGPALLNRLTVAPIEPYPRVDDWNGHLRVMPLPSLLAGKHYATRFVDVTAATADLLTRDRRVASLSNRGIYLLQQRLVKHYTRLDVGLEVLRRQSAPVLEEAQQQWEWVDSVLTDAELLDQAVVDTEAKVFDDWLGQGDPPRRQRLAEEIHHADVRREARQAIKERRQERGTGPG